MLCEPPLSEQRLEEVDHYMDLIRRIMAGEAICLPDRVAEDEVAGYVISTVKLLVPIGDRLYESAVRRGEGEWQVYRRYPTPEEAIEWHQRLVAHVRLHAEVLPAFREKQGRKLAYRQRAGKKWSATQGPKKRRM